MPLLPIARQTPWLPGHLFLGHDTSIGIGIGVGITITITANSGLLHPRRQFSHTCNRSNDGQKNHYEVLDLAPDATPVQIKRSFYALSKVHHPDHNPQDAASAATRFARIYNAYSVLGTPAKRAAYDRDILRLRPDGSTASGSPGSPGGGGVAASAVYRRGSYYSTGPAGGRPASGLSRRRSPFRGPPPSYDRRTAQARAQAQAQAQARAQEQGEQKTQDHVYGQDSSFGRPGMGPGQDPFLYPNDVPHFDRVAHERTHRAHEQRREERQRSRRHHKDDPSDDQPGSALSFLVISGILASVLLSPMLMGIGSG